MLKGKQKFCVWPAALLSLALFSSLPVFGQTAGSIGGTVADTSQAVLPGAGVTAVNVDTGVESKTVANSTGVYNFPSLPPGIYNVTAEVNSFQKSTKTDVKVGVGSQLRLNFELAVAGGITEVEVSSSVESILLEAGSSTGTVLQETAMVNIPTVSNDVMDLINVMGGVVKSEDPIFSGGLQTFAGVMANNINVSRDGISVSEVRWASGIVTPGRANSEMIGEFKMILSPVDAELGRGAGQVQIMTRSGSNAFHGSGVWNIQNTALDAEEWWNKREGTKAPWRNLHDYTISLGGPIIKNRTFFFASWNQQKVLEKRDAVVSALTGCARLGIYRYFAGWNNQAYLTNTAQFVAPGSLVGLPARPVVDVQGKPLYDYTDPGTGYKTNPAAEQLMFKSVMGELSPAAYNILINDDDKCSAYAASGMAYTGASFTAPWSSLRNSFDRSGYVEKFNNMAPAANVFNYGDGLNTAGYRWTRRERGANTVFGTGQDGERKGITFKIDHNINNEHRLSGTYSLDKNAGEDSYPSWPNEYAYGGLIERKPQSFTASLTSTLNPMMLNEFRFGLSRTTSHKKDALVANPDELTRVLYDLMPISNVFPVIVGYDQLGFSPGINWMFNSTSSSHPFGSMGIKDGSWGGTDNRWTASDTITWMKGSHSFKGGFEIRLTKSVQETNGDFATGPLYPAVLGGPMVTSPYTNEFASWTADGMIGNEAFASGGYPTVRNLLDYFAGSVTELRQAFYVNSSNLDWNNIAAGDLWHFTDLRDRELAFFFKDDWKFNNNLTLNLGVRYEYYGVPWEESGMTAALKGGSSSIWGAYGGDFSNMMPSNPAARSYGGDEKRAAYQFVGPNSPNSNLSPWNKDKNNFAPHVGFSWQLPWLGVGKTTLRGGYSISFSPIGNFGDYGGYIGAVPGISYTRVDGPFELGTNYLTLNDLVKGSYFPLGSPDTMTPPVKGLQVKNVNDRRSAITVYDDNVRNPYVQNVNLSLTRQIGNAITFDIRYIGTLSRKQLSGININQPNFVNNGLLDALNAVRDGVDIQFFNDAAGNPTIPNPNYNPGDPGIALINALILPSKLWYGATGAAQLREVFDMNFANLDFNNTSTSLMQGDYATVMSRLATANGLTGAPSSIRGEVLRLGTFNGAPTPENLIFANPQFSSAMLTANRASSNYHSMQAQVTMRPVRGLSFQTTYTWSRNIADQGIVNYLTGVRRRFLASQHRLHALTSYGTFELPFGVNGFLFRNAAGAFKKTIEGWQLSWVASVTSGIPMSVVGASRYWGDSSPVLVRPDLWDNKDVGVVWDDATLTGNYFDGRYILGPDPQCDTIAPSLGTVCYQNGLRAVYLRNGNGTRGDLVMRNALPGEVGNFTPNSLIGPGRWSLDMAMSKAVEFMEGKKIEFRFDAQNIFNHPTPSYGGARSNARFTSIGNPNLTLTGSTENSFGLLDRKGGHRTFQAKIRLSF